jgi:hypothetical protein
VGGGAEGFSSSSDQSKETGLFVLELRLGGGEAVEQRMRRALDKAVKEVGRSRRRAATVAMATERRRSRERGGLVDG